MYRCRYQGEGHSCPWGCVACEYSDEEYKSRKKENALCPGNLKEDHFSKIPKDEFQLFIIPDEDNGKPKPQITEKMLDNLLSVQYKERRHVTLICYEGYQSRSIVEYADSRDVELHMVKNTNGRKSIRHIEVLDYIKSNKETKRGAILLGSRTSKESAETIREALGFPVKFCIG